MRRLDRIDTWDYIDRSAPRVVGWYLLDKPRDVLFDLARSRDWWHRRAAITAAFWIIRSGDLDDPLALCEILAADPEHLVQTNVGVALREIGRVDRARLEEFLARRGDELSAQRATRGARRAVASGLVIQIRPLADADRDDWLPLWRAYLEFYESELSDEQTALTLRPAGRSRLPASTARIAIGMPRAAVGIVHWLTHPATWSAGPYCYLEDLFVSPDARGSGAGRALIADVTDWARERVREGVLADAEPTRRRGRSTTGSRRTPASCTTRSDSDHDDDAAPTERRSAASSRRAAAHGLLDRRGGGAARLADRQ